LIKADYIIEFLAEAPQGQKYPYVIVGSTGKNYMWILSREKHPKNSIVEELISIAERKGYNVSKLQKYGSK
jgi:lipocalin